jgi:transcriptional regulator with XRE-family HTH domain
MAKTKEEKKLIGDTVSFNRRKLGMRQIDLSREIGISNVALSNIENGKSYPSARVFKALSETLKITPIELLGEYSKDRDINENGQKLLKSISEFLMAIYQKDLLKDNLKN